MSRALSSGASSSLGPGHLRSTFLRFPFGKFDLMDKKALSERYICTKVIPPPIQQSGWQQDQFREEVKLTDGRVMVRGKLAARILDPEAKGGPKRADFVLYARTNAAGHDARRRAAG
jgi:hypothetical protein